MFRPQAFFKTTNLQNNSHIIIFHYKQSQWRPKHLSDITLDSDRIYDGP